MSKSQFERNGGYRFEDNSMSEERSFSQQSDGRAPKSQFANTKSISGYRSEEEITDIYRLDEYSTAAKRLSPPKKKRSIKSIIKSKFGPLIEAWAGHDMAMDLGTANTLIYIKGKGIVLNEPSVVAISEDDGKAIAIGKSAKEMYGKTSRKVRCVRPLKDGVIADFDITHQMIKHFITSVSNRWQLRRPRLMISVPSGITMVEKRAVIDAAFSSGTREIHLIEEPMAAAIGAGIPVIEAGGHMIVDIGGGTTEVAVISMGATSYAESVRIAGDEMDEAIENFIRRAFNLQIGIFEAERIKINIGSAIPMEEPREMKIYGRDLTTGVPREIIIDDSVVRRALKEPVSAIIEAVMRCLERTSPELAEDIYRKGVFLAGGGSLLAGLPERLSLETGLKFIRSANPLSAIVKGAGMVIEKFDEMKDVCVA